MESYEETTHSFVVKVWLEDAGLTSGQVIWRGHITHVMSNERRYIQTLDEVTEFIDRYLVPADMKSSICKRITRWLKLRKT